MTRAEDYRRAVHEEWADFAERSAAASRLSSYLLSEGLNHDFFRYQVWPLSRVLAEVRCGSDDWSWDSEWSWLDAHDPEGLTELQAEIVRDGMHTPVLIGNDGRLWDGHHRLRIAVRLGMRYVPVELTPAAS